MLSSVLQITVPRYSQYRFYTLSITLYTVHVKNESLKFSYKVKNLCNVHDVT